MNSGYFGELTVMIILKYKSKRRIAEGRELRMTATGSRLKRDTKKSF